jgi:hypothetical protein
MYWNTKFWDQIIDYLFPYINLADINDFISPIYKETLNVNSLWSHIYLGVIWGLFLILISLLPLIFFKGKYLGESSQGDSTILIRFREYIIAPAFIVISISAVSLWLKWFTLLWYWLAILLYQDFNLKLFIEHNPAWIWTFFILPWIILTWYLYNKNRTSLLNFKEKMKSYIFIILIFIIGIIFLTRPEQIYFNDKDICKGDQCYLYTDIKSINIDHSSYELEIILKSFNTWLPIILSKWDMFNQEECDSDEQNSWCWLIHKPILDINDRLTFIVQEDKKIEGDEERISSEELSYFSEQKNFEKTLNAVVSWKIKYPDSLSQDWILVLKLLNKKTALYPKVIQKK